MLVQHISEREEWDAILLQELSFKDELLLSLEELEASHGGHKLVLEAGRSKASGSISWGSMPTAIFMTVMISGVCWSRNFALCIICSRYSNAFGRWLGSPKREACGRRRWISSSRASLPQKLRLQKNCNRGVITSRSACRGLVCQVLCSSSKGEKKSLAGWSPQTSSQHHELHSALSKHVSLEASVGEILQAFETVMEDVRM